MNYLVLMRHGESQWNRENRFTGFTDVDLNETGEAEAKRAGQALKAIKFDKVYTSTLKRAYRTAALAMSEAGQNPPTIKHDDLRERDYGDLTGLNKDETRKKFGDEQVQIWRRSYDVNPPGGESLKDVVARVKPYYEKHILPDLKAGKNILLAAHGNTLRAMLIVLGENTPENINNAEIATGAPLTFEFDGAKTKKESGMKKAKLVILRHGQTEHNKQRLFTGHLDVPLTKEGEAQARAAGALIKGIPFDKAYSSTLSRAFNTAALALKAAGQNIPIEQRKEIIEADAGEFTGRNIDADPDVVKFLRFYDAAPPGGESDKQVVARERKFFDEEVQPLLAQGKNVLIVAHSGSVRAFDIVLGLEPVPADGAARPPRRGVPNAGPAVHEYEDGVRKKSYALENPETEKAVNQNKPQKNAGKFKL